MRMVPFLDLSHKRPLYEAIQGIVRAPLVTASPRAIRVMPMMA
jgi:hypothetical protein